MQAGAKDAHALRGGGCILSSMAYSVLEYIAQSIRIHCTVYSNKLK